MPKQTKKDDKTENNVTKQDNNEVKNKSTKKEEIKEIKEIDDIYDFSENNLSILEYEAISCNITYMSEFLAIAQDYQSFKDLYDNIPTELCVRVEKKIQKKTNKGKDYFLLRLSDYNSGETFNAFEWNVKSGEKLSEGQSLVIKIKKSGDFISVFHSFERRYGN